QGGGTPARGRRPARCRTTAIFAINTERGGIGPSLPPPLARPPDPRTASTLMEPTTHGTPEPPKGLPPVTPPSGRFIAQLFLVPGLIVAVAVLLLLGVRALVGGAQTADRFLQQLDSPNADIRWRGAHDLAQVLKRPESLALASDPRFALDLAERLRDA